jgi:Big-like domain-containing protein/parallel beta helix pectate lyase-like protein
MIRRLVVLFFLCTILPFSALSWAQVTLHPSDNVPKIVSSKPPGTTFIFAPGTYRLSQSIIPKDNDKFVGETSCAPPASACSAILSGGVVIGSLATPDAGNYSVAKQMQQGPRANTRNCDQGWEGCIYPEDLFFDGVPYKHLDSPTMPTMGAGEWWFDYANHAIYFHDDPSGHTVETSVLNTAFNGPANNITIQYLTIQEFADMYPTGAVGTWHGKDEQNQGVNWTIENCEVKLNHGFGVRVGFHLHILNNYIHDNGQVGIGGGIGTPAVPSSGSVDSGIIIQGNTINHNNYAHFNPGFGAGGFKVGATNGMVLRGNTFRNNEGSGIHFDADSNSELVDGNIIADNSDGDGLTQEIGGGVSTFRNNIVLRNGARLNSGSWAYQIGVHASSGVSIYCNVMEIAAGDNSIGGWSVGAAQRGSSLYPPFQYHATFGNSVHHNTVIWDAGANGDVGFRQNDQGNQADFFAKNTPPDYNEYHMPNPSAAHFVYDNDNSRSNRLKNLSGHQRSRADAHSTVDANYTAGFPEVSITSPADQSSVPNAVTISAAASDKSGIKKVEFYVDWKLETTLTSSPYDFNWNDGTAGSHIVAAMAYSNAGIRACYAVTLNQQ